MWGQLLHHTEVDPQTRRHSHSQRSKLYYILSHNRLWSNTCLLWTQGNPQLINNITSVVELDSPHPLSSLYTFLFLSLHFSPPFLPSISLPFPLPTDRTLEGWVGRSKADSIEQSRKSVSAHVARMVGGATKPEKKPFEIVRHSQPYGTVTGESGLFFIG